MDGSMTGFLDSILQAVEEDRFNEIVAGLQQLLEEHPELLDQRAMREIRLIQKLLEYRADLQDWDYFRGLKEVYRECEERYATDEVCGPAEDPEGSLPEPDVIWWCWLQGADNAPQVARACLRSLEKLGREIRVLDRDNLSEYVTMPDHIIRKWQEGIIDNTHFADLVRLELLTERGGAWIDATAYCTDAARLKSMLEDAPLFCTRVVMQDGSSDYTTYDNWLLSATVRNGILNDTKRMLYAYWEQEDRLKHYFLFHIFFTLATWRHPDECAQIPVFSTEPCHVMQMEMLHPYTELRWQQLCDMSCIHKLTWKYDTVADLTGTILGHVLGL
jgi:hypothetical protein